MCALLTVGLIVTLTNLTNGTKIEAPGLVLIGLVFLPALLLFATIWAVIGFTKTVKRWIAENQVDDCPHVMHSWHSKDAAQMKKDYRALMYGAGPRIASKFASHDISDMTNLHTLEEVRKCLRDHSYCKSGGVDTVTLPWWVWDAIFHALPDELGHCIYTEGGPLADVDHLIFKSGDKS